MPWVAAPDDAQPFTKEHLSCSVLSARMADSRAEKHLPPLHAHRCNDRIEDVLQARACRLVHQGSLALQATTNALKMLLCNAGSVHRRVQSEGDAGGAVAVGLPPLKTRVSRPTQLLLCSLPMLCDALSRDVTACQAPSEQPLSLSPVYLVFAHCDPL